jgi:hypothetical protein
MNTLLSLDWDFFAGSGEHIFDSPLWGSPDLEFDRLERWRERAKTRGGTDFEVLRQDFPLFAKPRDWQFLERLLEGIPAWAVTSHDAVYGLLEQSRCSQVINLDSHHDLFSSSGNPTRLRPGNWAGLALEHRLIESYSCVYPDWHKDVRVSEGFDLERTWCEIGQRSWRDRVHLERSSATLESTCMSSLRDSLRAVVLVLSPAWSNPCFDAEYFALASALQAKIEPGLLTRAFGQTLIRAE